ncbi:hypothetical protein STCU_03641 [Strigomonas culicis]|uniref:C3H1-type domain-containing protein n=1 Tax=Strigomonas culicis TaxID=28005 RepID=S9UQD6_9TRYP|nr:hypothetical protein STCU_03641 [Strigomonas culicis]|eukprot:EPY31063.1 hypothetical protein STCU_03641 [Strigomonas culicis]
MLPYISRDVATEPPTTIVVISSHLPPPDLSNYTDTVFAISEECIEPTEGWLNREGKPSLTICFMHSFGKCAGRMNSDPSTCFQIHVKPNILNSLRRRYTNPTRQYFTRTVKTQLSVDLRQQLSQKAGKEVKVQYLEYRFQDVFPSTGLIQYEAAYRRWLFGDEVENVETTTTGGFSVAENNTFLSPPSGTSPPPKRHVCPLNVSVVQCTAFAANGMCSMGVKCPFIHANLRNAQVRDPALARALRDFSAVSTLGPAGAGMNSCQDGTSRSVPYPIKNTPEFDFGTIPVFTLVQTEVPNAQRLAPLQLDGNNVLTVQCNSRPPAGEEALTPATNTPAPRKNDSGKDKGNGKGNENGWISGDSNGGISSVNAKSGSSGSGSDS